MKTSLHKAFQVDLEAVNEGIWIEVYPGIEIKVARAGNAKYKAVIRRELEPSRVAIRNAVLTEEDKLEIVEKATLRSLSEAVLLDWSGVTDEEGKPVPCTPETAFQILSDPAMVDFRDKVEAACGELETFRAEAIEKAKENVKN